MTQLEDIYRLEKVWQKAYDIAKTTEDSTPKDDKVKYWLKVHLAWRIQDQIRDKIKAMTEAYVLENIDSLIADLSK